MFSLPRAVWAIFAVFSLESAVLGNWIPRIPDIKFKLGLNEAELGLCLLAIPLGTVLGLLVAARLLDSTGLRRGCQIFLPLWAALFVLPGLVTTAIGLGVSLLLAGFALGLVEVAMNTEADRIEQDGRLRIMSRCHGFWSLGSMAGALVGAGIAQRGVSVETHFLLVMPAIALMGLAAATALPVRDELSAKAEPASPHTSVFCVPSRAILLLCIMPMGIMAVEGAFIDWSAVFMRQVLDASPWVIGLTYSFFSGVMALTRLMGDRIAARFGDYRVVQASAVGATLGILLFALAPNAVLAFLAATLAGAGVAIVYPLAVSAAAKRPGRSSAENVAALTMVSFVAFLVAPPVIGFVAHELGLRWALGLLAPIAFTTVLLAGQVKPQSGDPEAH